MRFTLFLIFTLSLTISHSKDYTYYNNLTTLANKFIVGQRYKEANIIYEGIQQHYPDYFKSLDLYYWAKSLAYENRKEEALNNIKLAIKLHNDVWGVLYKVKKDTIFQFLTMDDLQKLETIERNDYTNLYNPTLAATIDSFIAIDQSCQNTYINEVNYLPKGSKERDEKLKEFAQCSDENVNHFVDYIIKNGYPNYLTTFVDPIVLLYHINTSEVWNKVEPTLQKALKEGLIRPFDYAYIYFRANQLDEKYNPLSFIEANKKNKLSEQHAYIIEAGQIGLGI